ncbi:MAG TPA: histidine triad nucleotide-binding protein [Candidatus Acidoferrales bacterium]|nr:histidine triad nucleotide-binding protein [Candidatus Acidoferrales bacterium]
MADDCIFCRIAAGNVPSTQVYRDDDVLAIEDVNPQAPVHLLVMPVRHHGNLADLVDSGDDALLARVMSVSARLGRERGRDGFRIAINTGTHGGQTVEHLHVHVLAGRPLAWPPG